MNSIHSEQATSHIPIRGRNRDVHIVGGTTQAISPSELWSYRELLYFFVWRDLLVRYKQAVLGVAWVALRPLLTMAAFTLIFGRLAGFSSGSVPYPIMVFAALLPWQFFADSALFGSASLLANKETITKVYFPRILIPSSAVICCFFDFMVAYGFLNILMLYYRFFLWERLIFLPFFLMWCFIFSWAVAIFIAALCVRYRDFKYVITFLVQFGLYLSPVGFSVSVIPEKWRFLYSFNPMVGIISGFRWALLGEPLRLSDVTVSMAITLVFVLCGLWYFRKAESSFADVI